MHDLFLKVILIFYSLENELILNYVVLMRRYLLNLILCCCTYIITIVFNSGLKADQNDLRLDDLFVNLRSAVNFEQATLFEIKIWDIWMEHKNPKVQNSLFMGLKAMKNNDYENALTHFNIVIQIEPEFAEGWNKRATVLYLMGRIKESEQDVVRTLKLEPRHFGALSGQGLIRISLKDWSGAIEVLEAGLEINPYMLGAIINLKFARKKFKESLT